MPRGGVPPRSGSEKRSSLLLVTRVDDVEGEVRRCVAAHADVAFGGVTSEIAQPFLVNGDGLWPATGRDLDGGRPGSVLDSSGRQVGPSTA